MWNETALMNIILGVTASIAAYKAADIASKLTKQDRSVHVVMTAGATQCVTPLTFADIVSSSIWTASPSPHGPQDPPHFEKPLQSAAKAFQYRTNPSN